MEKTGNYIRFDWAMNYRLCDKTNFGILEGLISVILKESITIKNIYEREPNCKSTIFNCLDIKAKNKCEGGGSNSA